MAFGDQIEEAACLLPGGSRVEALDIENLSGPSVKRNRFSTILLVCSVAVAACMAVATVRGLGNSSSVELEDASAATSKLPSWLRTDPVKLVPLNKLIKEREMMHEMAEGKISDKIYKEEHMKEGPSPHELAMHSVHVMAQKKQQTNQQQLSERPSSSRHGFVHVPRSASEKASEENFDVKQAAAIRHALKVAQEKAHGKHQLKEAEVPKEEESADQNEHSSRRHRVHAGKPAHVVTLQEIRNEINEEKVQLARLAKGEAQAVVNIQKQELHRLAELKRTDHVEEMKLKLGIEELEREEQAARALRAHHAAPTSGGLSEKAKIKAEMARIEEEEREKLDALQARLEKVGGHGEAHAAHQVDEDKSAPAELRSSAAAAPAGPKPARVSKLAECNKDNCDLDKEDQQWLAHKKSVDYYARLAETGHGQAKREAIRRMQALEKQITHDFHHVTTFAVAQEHALPPAPRS